MPHLRVGLWRKGIDSREFERVLRGSLSERAMADLIFESSPEHLHELYRNYRTNPNFDSQLGIEPTVMADRMGIPFADFKALKEIGAPLGSIAKLKDEFEQGKVKKGEVSKFISKFEGDLFDAKDITDSYLFRLRKRQLLFPSL